MFTFDVFYVTVGDGYGDDYRTFLAETWKKVTEKTKELQEKGWEIMNFETRSRNSSGENYLKGIHIYVRRPM